MALMTRIMDYQKQKSKGFEFFVADLHEAFVIDFRLAEGLAVNFGSLKSSVLWVT